MAGFRFFGTSSFFRRNPAGTPDMSGNTGRHHVLTNPFHAVSIDVASSACPAAKALRGQRFLSSDAPALPLKGCTQSECKCRYAHHEDRRAGPRRSSDLLRPQNPFFAGQERRRSGGRRITDH